ncbi:hypothetical protein [Desulforhabdus sp. TSK]|uniref:hypothetical protein n=1 Tax=Desulforhabdus sp. TSK TaxID=2925014 RepID=UPI001FC8E149|nr:hypothetical protein [Desulforhabdus sp. TSK]GKT06870.1 hypothetical protein DSTSK_01750 [Desulforhabdus sp. TSK]
MRLTSRNICQYKNLRNFSLSFDGSSTIAFKFDGEKTTFAKEVVPTLDAACFEVFRPMFEFIKSKCPTGAAGEEVAP